jgi:hypothetical protein
MQQATVVTPIKLISNTRQLNLYPSLFSKKAPSLSFIKDHPKNEKAVLDETKISEMQPYFKIRHFNYVSLRLSLLENGWRRIDDSDFDLWNVAWGRHLRGSEYANLHAFQKVNHFPGSGNLGRKDLLHANLFNAQLRYGKEVYGFFPEAFIMPYDLDKFQRVKHLNQVYISKPFAGSCGRGISLIKNAADTVLPSKPTLIQRYMDNPYLVNGKKFDFRLYVLCTSVDPLRIYLFEDGLVRFSTVDYKKESENILSHLTNYSLNKKSPDFVQNNTEDLTEEVDSYDLNSHKWSFKAFMNYLEHKCSDTSVPRSVAEQAFNRETFMQNISSVIIKTLLSTEMHLYSHQKQLLPANRNNCFELYGFDIMLDEHLNPWLVEVNLMPSLACSSLLDKRIKIAVLSQMFHTLGPIMFSRDPDKYDRQVRQIFESIKGEDKRIIMESEDELERSLQTDWRRIYPRDLINEKNRIYWPRSKNSTNPAENQFANLFLKPRTSNQILEAFEQEKERNGINSARSGL